jgi:7,8-dihydropterin-6-yl-methyl-4-(beta-D-ribofuranosyl)aminobenzene 5'-phosphate synthase
VNEVDSVNDDEAVGTGEFQVTCLVDNTVKLSSGLWAEHGSAFLIESEDAKVLFDTGQSGEVLAHNLAALNKDLQGVSKLVLSHGHYDHTGGIEHVLSKVGDVEVVAHPSIFDERISRDAGGREKSVGIPFSREYLETKCRLRLSTDPVEVAPGIFTSGQVPRGSGREPRDPRLQIRNGEQLVVDPLLDDLSLILKTRKGLVILLGCCHAGLINTMEHVSTAFSGRILALMGGTHLANVENSVLLETVTAVKERYGVQNAYVGHCSGFRGLLAFAKVFGEHCLPSNAGLSVTF